jgi:hypothetical protein
MMINGMTNASNHHKKSPSRYLARLIGSKYGKAIDTPLILKSYLFRFIIL